MVTKQNKSNRNETHLDWHVQFGELASRVVVRLALDQFVGDTELELGRRLRDEDVPGVPLERVEERLEHLDDFVLCRVRRVRQRQSAQRRVPAMCIYNI